MLKRYFLSIPMKFVLGCWCCASVLHRKVHISQCVMLGRSIAGISCRSEEPAGEQRHHHSSHWSCEDFGWIGSAAIGVEKQAHYRDMTCLYRINVDLAIKKDTFGNDVCDWGTYEVTEHLAQSCQPFFESQTGWGHPVISWFINTRNTIVIYHQP